MVIYSSEDIQVGPGKGYFGSMKLLNSKRFLGFVISKSFPCCSGGSPPQCIEEACMRAFQEFLGLVLVVCEALIGFVFQRHGEASAEGAPPHRRRYHWAPFPALLHQTRRWQGTWPPLLPCHCQRGALADAWACSHVCSMLAFLRSCA